MLNKQKNMSEQTLTQPDPTTLPPELQAQVYEPVDTVHGQTVPEQASPEAPDATAIDTELAKLALTPPVAAEAGTETPATEPVPATIDQDKDRAHAVASVVNNEIDKLDQQKEQLEAPKTEPTDLTTDQTPYEAWKNQGGDHTVARLFELDGNNNLETSEREQLIKFVTSDAEALYDLNPKAFQEYSAAEFIDTFREFRAIAAEEARVRAQFAELMERINPAK